MGKANNEPPFGVPIMFVFLSSSEELLKVGFYVCRSVGRSVGPSVENFLEE